MLLTVLALSVVFGADSPGECMDADLSYGTLKDGKLDKVRVEKEATVLCVTAEPSGVSFTFPAQLGNARVQYTSPALLLKDATGTEEDRTFSVLESDGRRYSIRLKPESISACIFNKPAKIFLCATVRTEEPDAGTMKRKAKQRTGAAKSPDAGRTPEETGKTY